MTDPSDAESRPEGEDGVSGDLAPRSRRHRVVRLQGLLERDAYVVDADDVAESMVDAALKIIPSRAPRR